MGEKKKFYGKVLFIRPSNNDKQEVEGKKPRYRVLLLIEMSEWEGKNAQTLDS